MLTRITTSLAAVSFRLTETYQLARADLSGWVSMRRRRGCHRLTRATELAGKTVDDILNRVQIERLHTTVPSF